MFETSKGPNFTRQIILKNLDIDVTHNNHVKHITTNATLYRITCSQQHFFALV